ncbi:FKBP-type peptidyl-prolyl cis-trans isomerase [Microbacterium sp. XT11]|uniref:FKBP-type peptidyl-prolyl cis-trans isomerase n=1 Tax=Microbacterium sp. XT11 TaxID=367477 RepID=UPI00082C2625|nr:hypothetical protein [Microbacterium sp. XT11]
MRKTSAVLATLSLAVLALTGCSSAPSYDGASCDRPSGSTGVAASVTADGAIGEKPDADVFAPVRASKTTYADLITGDGPAVVSASQGFVAEITIFNGATGEQVFQSAYDPSRSAVHTIDYWASLSPGLATVLPCATQGSRIVAALPAKDFGEQNSQGFGFAKDDTAVFVIDMVDVYLPKAEGALQFNDASGMPTVVRAADGTPGIIVPDSAAPKKDVTQTLIKGDGPVVKKGDTVVTNFTGVNWDTKKVTNSTWGKEPSVAAAAEQLVGATVGSQVLVVIPGADGGAATAVVIDVLGITSAPAP